MKLDWKTKAIYRRALRGLESALEADHGMTLEQRVVLIRGVELFDELLGES